MRSNSRTWALRLASLGLAIALAGCDSEQVRLCETQLKDKLKSPASYKRIKVEITKIDSSINKTPYDDVTITYDAANSFNALLRDTETCTFRPGTTDQFEPFESAIESTDMNADAALNATDMNTDLNATATDASPESDAPADNYDVNNDAGE